MLAKNCTNKNVFYIFKSIIKTAKNIQMRLQKQLQMSALQTCSNILDYCLHVTYLGWDDSICITILIFNNLIVSIVGILIIISHSLGHV